MSDTEENRAPPAEQNDDIKPTGEESDPNAPINIKVSILANDGPALSLSVCELGVSRTHAWLLPTGRVSSGRGGVLQNQAQHPTPEAPNRIRT